MEVLVLQAVSGLLKAMFLFLLASGLSLIFGVSRVLNLAHGAFYTLGAYLLLSASRNGALAPWVFFGTLAVITIAGATGGAGFEVLVLRRVYRAGTLFLALVTFGALMIAEEMVKILWSAELVTVPRPSGFDGGLAFGHDIVPLYSLLLLGAGCFLGVLLWAVVEHTRFGLLVRAAAMDREMLSVLGIDVPRLYTITFAAGGALATIAGALAAPMVSLSPSMGSTILIETFAVVVIGGLGSLPGSLLGALIVGEFEAFGILVSPEVASPLLYLLMAAILIIRPSGLLGTPDR